MDDTQNEIVQSPLSDLAQAIQLFCEKVDMPIRRFQREITVKEKSYTLHPRQVRDIFSKDQKRSKTTRPTQEKILRFFAENERLYIPEAFYDMSIPELKNALTKVNKFSPNFFSVYQVIRPFQNATNLYALEAFEITADERGIMNIMYSHNFKDRNKLSDEYYEGKVLVAERYYFSLLSRPHEKRHGDSAFRCVTFYIAEELEGDFKEFLFGLMLRGVSGEKSESRDYAVATPFIAIPCGPSFDLRNISPIDLFSKVRTKTLYKVHEDRPILLGEINEATNKKIFQYCKNIFENELFRKHLFIQNPLVLHGIPQNRLDSLGISKSSWEECLNESGINE